MTKTKYAFGKFNQELMARALARDAAVSTKTAIEMCNYLRHRKLQQAKRLLQEVLEMKRAIPFKRFTDGVGHRKGKLASGRFPQKGSTIMLKLLESVEANAQLKGLNTGELSIIHICAHKAHTPVHYGRNAGRDFKRTHVEIVVQETPAEEPKKKGKASAKKKTETKSTPAKKEEKKPVEKPVENVADKPVENVVDKSAEKPVVKPAEKAPAEANKKQEKTAEKEEGAQ